MRHVYGGPYPTHAAAARALKQMLDDGDIEHGDFPMIELAGTGLDRHWTITVGGTPARTHRAA